MSAADRRRRNPIGVSTWLWVSPLSDAELARVAPMVRDWGFDVIELPIEGVEDWDPGRATTLLQDVGLGATTCAVMTPERDLTSNDAATRHTTADYLRRCVEIAAAVGSPVVAGPMYAPVGRVWRSDATERATAIDRVADGLRPVAEFARSCGVRLAIEPLNRYETSLINTVDQALELVDRVDSPGLGLCLDTFHMNIEEKDPAGSVRVAGDRIAHIQACGTDRGTPGADRFDWPAFVAALEDAGYGGPVCIESFTVENASLARAASIWRPLAPSADALAIDGLAFLSEALGKRHSGAPRAGDHT